MRIKSGFAVRKIADSYMAIPVGIRTADVSGVIALSETGAFLWKLLDEDLSEEELIGRLTEEYEVSFDTAAADVKAFSLDLLQQGWIDEITN